MKRSAKIAAAVAGSALVAGAIAVPVVASASGPGPGNRPGYQQVVNGAAAMDRDRVVARDGTGLAAGSVVAGTLTASQRTELARLAEQEKLARDLYTAFAKAYDAPVFGNLAAAEANHLQALRTLMDRYSVAIDGLNAPAAERVYGTLRTAETRHLAAINIWLAR